MPVVIVDDGGGTAAMTRHESLLHHVLFHLSFFIALFPMF